MRKLFSNHTFRWFIFLSFCLGIGVYPALKDKNYVALGHIGVSWCLLGVSCFYKNEFDYCKDCFNESIDSRMAFNTNIREALARRDAYEEILTTTINMQKSFLSEQQNEEVATFLKTQLELATQKFPISQNDESKRS